MTTHLHVPAKGNEKMVPRSISIAVAAVSLLALSLPAFGQPMCRPALAVTDVRFSQMVGLKRYWWASIKVDDSRCAESSGSFEMNFVRTKENGEDLAFSERVGWQRGPTDVVVEFWADEAVLDYKIGTVSPCTCRG
jgi:hypothetical protein